MPTTYAGQDWGGADFPTLQDGDIVYGTHTGVGNFVVPSSTTVSVLAYDTGISSSGAFSITCRNAIILGSLTATGKGPGGGGGGAGGGGAFYTYGEIPYTQGLGGVTGSGFQGSSSAGFAATGEGKIGANPSAAIGGAGGVGGAGAGDYRGITPGSHGGYRGTASNGDTSTNYDVFMGSGGAGGSGGTGGDALGVHTHTATAGGGGGGGGGGGLGGGSISITAGTIYISSTGSVTATALGRSAGQPGVAGSLTAGPTINGGTGGNGFGNVSLPAGSGGAGGAGYGGGGGDYGNPGTAGTDGGKGAGGGILILCSSFLSQVSALPRVTILGSVDNTGGLVLPAGNNGGTLKIFAPTYAISGALSSGRNYGPTGPEQPTVIPFGTMAG